MCSLKKRRSRWVICWGAMPFLLAAACSRSSAPSVERSSEAVPFDKSTGARTHIVRFVDNTTESGVRFVYDNGEGSDNLSIVETLGGGVAMLDYDRDGRLDLCFPGGGHLKKGEPLQGLPNSLWQNLGGARFADVSIQTGIAPARNYSHGLAVADFDNDGFGDVLVTGYGGLQMYRNQGDGTFVDRTANAAFDDSAWSSSAAWGDFDGDGNLDVYIAHYLDWSWENHPRCPSPERGVDDICTPNDFGPLADVIYMNNGDGSFRAADDSVGLRSDGKGLGVITLDVNGDSQCDIYVANDTTDNFLYLNAGDGGFREAGMIGGVAVDEAGAVNGSMGLAALDFDQNLQPDLWVTNFENETFALYQNQGGGGFLCGTTQAGVNALGTLYVGFGTVAADFDLDGDEDIVVANGHLMQHPRSGEIAQLPLFLESLTDPGEARGARKLVRNAFDSDNYFSQQWRGRGVVSGDLDLDGKLDLVFSNINQPSAILLNETPCEGSSLSIDLIGRGANRDAIGAQVVLQTDRESYARWVVGGGSYASQQPYTVTFGVPAGQGIQQVQVTWPDGMQERVAKFPNTARFQWVQGEHSSD